MKTKGKMKSPVDSMDVLCIQYSSNQQAKVRNTDNKKPRVCHRNRVPATGNTVNREKKLLGATWQEADVT